MYTHPTHTHTLYIFIYAYALWPPSTKMQPLLGWNVAVALTVHNTTTKI